MIRPQGEVMRSKVKTFAAALKLEGDPASWSKEILATNVDEATGRKLCQDAFAAQRKDREDKSLMISVNESDRLVARFGPAARQSAKKEKKRCYFLDQVEAITALPEAIPKRKQRRLKNLTHPGIKKVLGPLAAAITGADPSPPPLELGKVGTQKRALEVVEILTSDSDDEAHKKRTKKAKKEPSAKVEWPEDCLFSPFRRSHWSCEVCTFNENPENFLACKICGNPRFSGTHVKVEEQLFLSFSDDDSDYNPAADSGKKSCLNSASLSFSDDDSDYNPAGDSGKKSCLNSAPLSFSDDDSAYSRDNDKRSSLRSASKPDEKSSLPIENSKSVLRFEKGSDSNSDNASSKGPSQELGQSTNSDSDRQRIDNKKKLVWKLIGGTGEISEAEATKFAELITVNDAAKYKGGTVERKSTNCSTRWIYLLWIAWPHSTCRGMVQLGAQFQLALAESSVSN